MGLDYETLKMREQERADKHILSILIPTIPERIKMFNVLRTKLAIQIRHMKDVHPTIGKIEVLKDCRPKFTDGGPDIGTKRGDLVKRAKGKYLCFLDDDESISPDYVETLARMCLRDRDICTFSNVSKFDNFWCVVVMKLEHDNNEQAFPGIIKRRPWHICPVRSEIAKKESFPVSNYGEDWVWFEKVLSHCKTEINSPAIIHQYNHSIKVSQSDNVTTSIG